VDFDEHGADSVDPWFYDSYLRSLRSPHGVEALLSDPKQPGGAWMADLAGLRELGWIEGAHQIRLTPLGLAWADILTPTMRLMVDAPSPEERARAAVALEDHVMANENRRGQSQALSDLARGAVRARSEKLESRVRGKRSSEALRALVGLGRQRAEPTVVAILKDPIVDGLASIAVEAISSWNDPAHDQSMLLLASRALGTSPPEPHLRVRIVEVVLRHYRSDSLPNDTRRIVLQVLDIEPGFSAGKVALLSTLVAPETGMQRLAQALRHSIPLARIQAAAGLALLGTAEAAEVLRGSSTSEARVALTLLRGHEPTRPSELEGEPILWRGKVRHVYKFDEIREAHLPEMFRSELISLQEDFGPMLERWWAS
jgi:hypothetical protein